jgi:hypothetical protein
LSGGLVIFLILTLSLFAYTSAAIIIAATQRYPPDARDVELEYELPQTGAGMTTHDSAAIVAIAGNM